MAYQAEKAGWREIPEGSESQGEILGCVFGEDGATKCLWALISQSLGKGG